MVIADWTLSNVKQTVADQLTSSPWNHKCSILMSWGGQILQQVLRHWTKFPVWLDIALQKNRDILFATAVFGVAAVS